VKSALPMHAHGIIIAKRLSAVGALTRTVD
jgi:hypothetical protein